MGPAGIEALFPGARAGDDPVVDALAREIEAAIGGAPIRFALSRVDLESCGAFQRRVLEAEHAIPRGWVASYGGIAARIGAPRAARAVGRALATNPFPVVVPCHRAVRGDGGLGGFQGGVEMKRALLEMEGVAVSPEGRVIRPRLFYTGSGASNGPHGNAGKRTGNP